MFVCMSVCTRIYVCIYTSVCVINVYKTSVCVLCMLFQNDNFLMPILALVLPSLALLSQWQCIRRLCPSYNYGMCVDEAGDAILMATCYKNGFVLLFSLWLSQTWRKNYGRVYSVFIRLFHA